MDLNSKIIFKVLRENPELIQINNGELQRLFYEECYSKLKRISNLLHDISLEKRQCLDEIYKVLFE